MTEVITADSTTLNNGSDHMLTEAMKRFVDMHPLGQDSLPLEGAVHEMERADLYRLVESYVGNTSVVKLPDFGDAPIYQKQEFLNPSGSHYDRAYLPTIHDLEESGSIRPGDELRDITSGSAGISLSLLARLLGYRARITVPDELPETRVLPMKLTGAEVVYAGSGYIKAASDFQATEIKSLLRSGWKRLRSSNPEMRAIVLERNGKRLCYVNHSENLLTPLSFRQIGHELVRRFQDQEPPAAIALAMGNWTTIAGISPVVRAAWPDTHIIGYEGTDRHVHDNYGTTVDGIKIRFKNENLVDSQTVVNNTERDAMDHRFNARRHIKRQLGHSSLMGLVVAEREAEGSGSRPVISIAYDQRSRYRY